MDLDHIANEYETNGRLSLRSIDRLRDLIRGQNPYSAITLAADCGVVAVSEEIANAVRSSEKMVRWNAVAALFTRFRNAEYGHLCLQAAKEDTDTMVRSIALCGLGEILPYVTDAQMRAEMAHVLHETLHDANQFGELRESAYEGILAAIDVLPTERPPATKRLKFPEDIDPESIAKFSKQYLSDTRKY